MRAFRSRASIPTKSTAPMRKNPKKTKKNCKFRRPSPPPSKMPLLPPPTNDHAADDGSVARWGYLPGLALNRQRLIGSDPVLFVGHCPTEFRYAYRNQATLDTIDLRIMRRISVSMYHCRKNKRSRAEVACLCLHGEQELDWRGAWGGPSLRCSGGDFNRAALHRPQPFDHVHKVCVALADAGARTDLCMHTRDSPWILLALFCVLRFRFTRV